jgi:hypothetical protein
MINQAVGRRPPGSNSWEFKDHAWIERVGHGDGLAMHGASLYACNFLQPYQSISVFSKLP